MGILTRRIAGDEEARLNTMIQSMRHEPFYSYGSFCDKTKGIFVGYTTLQGSFSDCLPIYNETNEILLFLTGEVYPDSSVIHSLQSRGHQFNPDDASFLVHLFEENEKSFFDTLNGSYNGILIDLSGNRVILFNDRYGVRRLYYAEIDSGLIFSAEAKALLKAYPSLRELNHRSIGEYLVYDCILEDRTFFNNINILPPGSAWSITNGNIRKTRYHDPEGLESQPKLSPENFSECFIDVFKKVLPRYFMRGSIGLGLTGGLDTRSILACSDLEPGQMPCYTFGIKNRNTHDVRIAPLVAKACHQPHSILEIDEKQFLKNYPENVEEMIYQSDGSGNVLNLDLYHLNKMSRQISQIRMTGKYGTEVLKNGRGLKQDTSPHKSLIDNDFIPFLTEARVTRSTLPPSTDFIFYLYSDLPWWWHKYIAIESTQVDVRSPYLDNDLVKLVHQAPTMSTEAREKIQLKLIAHYNPALLQIPSTSLHRESEFAIPRLYKKFTVTAEKVFGREKVPFGLTHTVARIDKWTKPMGLERWLAGRWIWRNYRAWFRDQLSQYLVDTLLCPRTYSRPFWNRASLNRIVRSHISGRGMYVREIRKILQIELISRVFVD